MQDNRTCWIKCYTISCQIMMVGYFFKKNNKKTPIILAICETSFRIVFEPLSPGFHVERQWFRC